jgi:SAM-dependent methyltransferase
MRYELSNLVGFRKEEALSDAAEMRARVLRTGTKFAHFGRESLDGMRAAMGLRYYHELNLPYRAVDRVVREAGAQEWFAWSVRNRQRYGQAASAMDWIVANVDRGVPILETGCGAAANLIWLGQHGFASLIGRDNSAEAIAAARGLANLARLSIDLAVDDCFTPRFSIPKVGVVVGLGWCYLSADFDLCIFLKRYRGLLKPGGFVVFDMVHSVFNHMPDNQDMTDDWQLPPNQRRPTQYKIRMTEDEVRDAARTAGFDLVTILRGTETPPRFVWVLKSSRLDDDERPEPAD